jgi:hypothetical protein
MGGQQRAPRGKNAGTEVGKGAACKESFCTTHRYFAGHFIPWHLDLLAELETEEHRRRDDRQRAR